MEMRGKDLKQHFEWTRPFTCQTHQKTQKIESITFSGLLTLSVTILLNDAFPHRSSKHGREGSAHSPEQEPQRQLLRG